ncbi:MAG: hypothetical protein AAGH15_06885 [Myxococcota bacterium]
MLLYLATGVALGVAFHSSVEPGNIRNRVAELDAKLKGRPYEAPPALPFAIDTPAKALGVGMAFTLIPAAIAFALMAFLEPPETLCLGLIIAVLLLKEARNTLSINAYHEEIGAVIEDVGESERTPSDTGATPPA